METSVIISTYNGMAYIEEQLDSILDQSIMPDQVLIFDDCSTDGTDEFVLNYIQKNNLSNWKLHRNENNKGWKKNFIEGIWQATGDLIFTCDQDDIWVNNKIEVVSKIFEENTKIELLTTNCIAFYDDGSEVIRPQKENNLLFKQNIMINFFEVPYPGCTYAFRKSLAWKSRLYWEQDFPHDALLWRMALYSDSAYSLNTSLIKWRKHNTSTYTIESVKSKSYESKRAWLDYADRALLSIEKYMLNENVKNRDRKEKNIAVNKKWVNLRKKFYETAKLKFAFQLLLLIRVYPRKRQFFGDVYLIAKNRLMR